MIEGMQMDLLSLIPDNIAEVLVEIMRFTELRRHILHHNIHSVDAPGFVPQDMPVREFAEVLNDAVAEHMRSRRLLFRDTANITFGLNNSTRVRPVVDTCACDLLRKSRDEYLELQVNKLLENALNRKVAAELLRQKCGVCPTTMEWSVNMTLAGDAPLESSSTHCDTTE
jgi:flagellar basal body rod protein FlgB